MLLRQEVEPREHTGGAGAQAQALKTAEDAALLAAGGKTFADLAHAFEAREEARIFDIVQAWKDLLRDFVTYPRRSLSNWWDLPSSSLTRQGPPDVRCVPPCGHVLPNSPFVGVRRSIVVKKKA